MRVLLTGASGFLGQYVLKRLVACGIETVSVGRTLPANCQAADFIQADLLGECDFSDMVAHADATHLLHLAWYAEHGAYWTSPLNYRWAEASIRLVEAFCLSGGQQVVMAGTCAEYDWAHGYCTEDLTPIQPNTTYGVAKDATRRLAAEVCSGYRVAFAWGRIFLPYGHGEDGRRLLPSLIAVYQGKRAPFGINGTAYRDFLHADDLAAGFVRLLHADAAGVYNICSGQPVQLAEVVHHIAQLYGADPGVILDLSTERPGEPRFLVGDNQKLKMLGWNSMHTFLDELRNLV